MNEQQTLVDAVVCALMDKLETTLLSVDLKKYCTKVEVTIIFNKEGTKIMGGSSLSFNIGTFKNESK